MLNIFLGLWLLIGVITLIHLFILLRKRQSFRGLVVFFRMGTLLGVLLLINQAEEQSSVSSKHLLAFVDTSRSMQQTLGLQEEHFTSVEDLLPSSLVKKVKDHYPGILVHFVDLFSSSLIPNSENTSSAWTAQSPIFSNMLRFIEQAGLPKDSRLMLISDGHDTQTAQLTEIEEKMLTETGVKVDTLLWEAKHLETDIALEQVYNPRVVFVKSPVSMQVKIFSNLPQAQETHLILTDGQSILNKQTLLLDAGTRQVETEISWTPVKPGDNLLYLRILPVEGERNLYNNVAYLPVSTRPKKLRVLHIAGRPSWDVKHLRTLLRESPEIDMTSFYILRDPFEDIQNVPESELSLIQFPVDVLFQVELFKFDTVIFHNFAIQKYLKNQEFQQSFQKYLGGGKRIIVIGGEQVAENYRYQELFFPPETKRVPLEFYHADYWSFNSWSRLSSENLRNQPSFQLSPVTYAEPSTPFLKQTVYQLGKVDWVLEPLTWKWSYPAFETLGQAGTFPAFWQALLYQPHYKQTHVFPQFYRPDPYHVNDSIASEIHFPVTPLNGARFQLTDQLLNMVVYDEEIDVSHQPAYVTLPRLLPSVYEASLSCGCPQMARSAQSITIVDEWLERKSVGIQRLWLKRLSEITQGQSLEISL
ncbi:hypothetical protein WDW89_10500 [Deltaproteobacteria bacterium TL4]